MIMEIHYGIHVRRLATRGSSNCVGFSLPRGVSTVSHVEVTKTVQAAFRVAWVSLSWIGHRVTLPGEHWGGGRDGSFGPTSTRQSQLLRTWGRASCAQCEPICIHTICCDPYDKH